jgi:two-component system OmpR family sensor kinase
LPSTSPSRRRVPSFVPLITEIVALTAFCGTAATLVGRFDAHGAVVQRALPVLALAAGVATSILLIVAAWMSADAAARRIAAAVGLYTVVLLLTRAVGLQDSPAASSAAVCLATLGSGGLLLLTAGREFRSTPGRSTALVVCTVATAAVVIVTSMAVSGPVAGRSFQTAQAVSLLGWSGFLVSALPLLAVGSRTDRGLLRRVGLAFAMSAIAHILPLGGGGPVNGRFEQVAATLELGGAALLLVGAALFLVATLHGVLARQEVTETRLAEAEAVMADQAERDHEIRNLVAGLSGAANVLKSDGANGTVDGRRLLVAAGAELERLQHMVRPDADPSRSTPTSVTALLADLAAMHRAAGLTVHVEPEGDPEVAMERKALSQVLTNLLVNCSRHAPGAPVWLRCRSHADTVRIEVVDAGPGLPAGANGALLNRGVRGPGSTGEGLGLAISADIVGRHGGIFTLRSGRRGCVARLDLPSSTRDLPLRVRA